MKTPAIKISALSKVFRVWSQPHDMFLEAITGRRRHEECEALTGINLEVARGSVVGILGRNGAGKSTLLRIVAGTLDATAGSVAVDGRVAAILELGTGFHPEYTGRENVILGGLCLGLNREEIAARFDEIVEFAELHEVIDRPFKTYSSGMQARLTFAVATSVDADVLIIDEALAVGDARFQLKSFDRVRRFKSLGRSILLVSHDINQIVSVCDRAILLERGRIIADDDPARVGNQYHELLFGPRSQSVIFDDVRVDGRNGEPTVSLDSIVEEQSVAPVCTAESIVESDLDREPEPTPAPIEIEAPVRPVEHRYGEGSVQIVDVRICDRERNGVSAIQSLGRYGLVCRIRSHRAIDSLCFGMLIRDRRGLDLFGWDMLTGGYRPLAPLAAGELREITLWFNANLAAGDYFVTVALARWDGLKYDVRFDALDLKVESTPTLFSGSVLNLDVSLDAQCESVGDVANRTARRV
jgi:lipopolysaccharide transport system ATP-binding protein